MKFLKSNMLLFVGVFLTLLGLGQGYYFTFNDTIYLTNQSMFIALSTCGYLIAGILIICSALSRSR